MIGVFDSGVGGLSVLRHIRDQMPGEQLAYVADSAWAPYGSRSAQEIRDRSMAITRFLLSEGAQAIVVACNTATSAAVASLRECFDIPIIGMEPAVKPAVRDTKSGVVGVLATEGTLASEKFATLLEEHGKRARVISQPCPGFVELVERGELDTELAKRLVKSTIGPLLEQEADILVLGCTHFPFLMPLIQELAGPAVTLIDTGIAVAREVKRRVSETTRQVPTSPSRSLPVTETESPLEQFWTSGNPAATAKVRDLLWSELQGIPIHDLPRD